MTVLNEGTHKISAGVQVVDPSKITFLSRIPVIHLSSSRGEGHIVAADPVRHAGTTRPQLSVE
ncbi:hypothetical protein ARMGADRAFT_1015524, partial [Armillaria gallica]